MFNFMVVECKSLRRDFNKLHIVHLAVQRKYKERLNVIFCNCFNTLSKHLLTVWRTNTYGKRKDSFEECFIISFPSSSDWQANGQNVNNTTCLVIVLTLARYTNQAFNGSVLCSLLSSLKVESVSEHNTGIPNPFLPR